MATHHVLKDGTSYAVSGGTSLMNGTKYQIGGGRTLIDGTVYEIGFGPKICTLTITGSEKTGTSKSEVLQPGSNMAYTDGTYQLDIGEIIRIRLQKNSRVIISVDGVEVYVGAATTYSYTLTTGTVNVNFMWGNAYITTQ